MPMLPTNMQLQEQLKRILIQELQLMDIRPQDIQADEALFGDKMGLDSIDALEIIHQVKQYFGVEIRDMKEGRQALQTIGTLAQFIENQMVTADC